MLIDRNFVIENNQILGFTQVYVEPLHFYIELINILSNLSHIYY